MNLYNYLENYRFNHDVSYIPIYKMIVSKEKVILRTLSMFKNCGTYLVGLVWVPADRNADFADFQKILAEKNLYCQVNARAVDPELIVPTFFKSTAFADVSQLIVDTYGVPLYKEANPALFCTVTFPFLFAIMFGDVMHGAMLLAVALWVLASGPENPAYAGRHFLLLMGIFATYTGVIYNDYASVPLYLFGDSCYEYHHGHAAPTIKDPACVYPIGVDPAWYLGTTELTFLNSIKMKIAVIFGVAQMSIGVCLKGANSLYFKRWMDFFFEFIPQILVLLCLFGYMDYLIIAKWLTDWSGRESGSPSVITTVIDMALNGAVPSNEIDLPILSSAEAQTSFGNSMMLTVILCVPIMLMTKPLVIYYVYPPQEEHEEHQKAPKKMPHTVQANDDDGFHNPDHHQAVAIDAKDPFGLHESIKASAPDQGHGVHSLGELFIHQGIETIEFVLGTVSNTASYLRLWALSLAHSQLAKVFFDMCLGGGFVSSSFVSLFFGFFVFMFATIGVLMCMDLLECCLHTLRLHWVEFQSKFFKGGGIPFTPILINKAC
jgi:V-type H+-transporting ATPase subunit a